MQEFVNDVLVPALGIGALYGLVGISTNLIFAPAGTFNFAQGQIVMLGGLLTYSLYQSAGLPLVLVILIVGAIGVGVGLAEERLAVWPALRKDPRGGLSVLSTLAAATVIQGFAIIRWGSTPKVVVHFPGLSLTRHSVLGLEIPTYYVATLSIAILVTIGVYLFFARTMVGRTFAATAQDREAARLRGISVRNVLMLGFGMGAALASLTGLLAVPFTLATITSGLLLTFRGFMSAAIGGMGSYVGALAGGLLLGLIEQSTQKYWQAGYTNLAMLGVLLAVLLLRPQGLFGRAEARRI